jgi:protein tyrosine/serine phosphatase
MTLDVPFPHSYWVVPGKFLAGCYPGSEDPTEVERRFKAFLDHGLRTFIDLMEPWERNWSEMPSEPYPPALKDMADSMGIETVFYRFGIEDFGLPSEELMVRILDVIDRSIDENRPVYVHCRGGIGRSGTVVGCYLARHGYASGEDVLRMINDLRRFTPASYMRSPEASEQREMVRSWRKGK